MQIFTQRVARVARVAKHSTSIGLCVTKPPPIYNGYLSQSSRQQFSTSQASHAPPAPPSSGYAPLISRRLIYMVGDDAPKFLQGLVTSDILKNREQPGFYSGFLTATGRVLHDVFIYRDTIGLGVAAGFSPPHTASGENLCPDSAYLIEVDKDNIHKLMAWIKRYRLRSKFKYLALLPYQATIWQVWDDTKTGEAHDELLKNQEGCIVLKDPRAPGLGYRVVTTDNRKPVVELNETHHDAYTIRRYLKGVAEGMEIDSANALPLEMNMDLMGGIDFRKGCYVGQELTIRTKHRGIVRKRILPCMVYGLDEPAPGKLEYKPHCMEDTRRLPSQVRIEQFEKKGRKTGNWIGGVGNIGLALCRLQTMTEIRVPGEDTESTYTPDQRFALSFGGESQQLLVKAFVPEWLRAKLYEPKSTAH